LIVFAFALGAAIGSFLNVVADRVPAGRSIVSPRSFCETCDRSLTTWDLLPIISYLWLRGKCRYCATRIPARLTVMEAVNGLLIAGVYLRYGGGLDFVILTAAVSALVVIARIDLERELILNSITYPSVVVLLAIAPFWSELGVSRPFLGDETIVASLLSSLVGGAGYSLFFLSIVLVYAFVVGGVGMGVGDVKLAAVIGLLVGIPGAAVALWVAAVSGGFVAIILLASGRKGRKEGIPFGPFMSLGAFVVVLSGADLVDQYIDAIDFFA
jgi:leader peptidase (prepilin peptidase)/N-methyltransferase